MALDGQPSSTNQDLGTICSINLVSNDDHVNDWIIDSGAINHMTYDPNDFKTKSVPQWQAISNTNGDIYLVIGGGTMELSTNFTLHNIFFVLSLSTKLLLVSQVTEDLNCCVLMYFLFCLF